MTIFLYKNKTMSTASAIGHRVDNTKTQKITIELVLAQKEDLIEFVGWTSHYPPKKKLRLRIGMIYWLYSSVKNKIEDTPRIITVSDTPQEIKEWLDLEMIYVAKNQFKT